jgi:hypothetical protein
MILTKQYNKTITMEGIKNILQTLNTENKKPQDVQTDHFFYPSVVDGVSTSLFFDWNRDTWYLETH